MKRAVFFFFFFSSRRRHTRFDCDWSSDVCSSDLRHGVPRDVQARPWRRDLERGREEPAGRHRVRLRGERPHAEAPVTRPVDELLAAVRGRDRAAAVAALDRDPSLVTARTASGETPVLLAIYHRAPDVLTLLRARGATLDVFEAAAAGD